MQFADKLYKRFRSNCRFESTEAQVKAGLQATTAEVDNVEQDLQVTNSHCIVCAHSKRVHLRVS